MGKENLTVRDRIVAAAKAWRGEPLLTSVPLSSFYIYGPEDDVINRKGLDGYLEMAWTDPEVSSCLWHMLTLSIPGVSVAAEDDSPEAERNAAFIDAVLNIMDGSTLDTFQLGLLNAIITGFTVQEPAYRNILIPGSGAAIGLRGLDVRPSMSFIDGLLNGIEVDKFGQITGFRQSSEFGGGFVTPEQVVYWAHLGGPDQRYGMSCLRPVYEPWAAKIKIRRAYQVFMATNASGLRKIAIPDKIFDSPSKAQDAKTVIEKIGTLSTIAYPQSWGLEIGIPPSGAGAHFKAMLDFCNAEIRRGLLGDSAFSSQEGSTGSYASREISQQNVQGRFAALGRSYMESVTEQLCPMLLSMNGLTGPVPKLVPLAAVSGPQAREAAFRTLGELKQAGILTVNLPDAAQLQILRTIAEPLDIEITEIEEKQEPVQTPPEPEPEPTPPVKAAESQKQKQGRRQAEQLTDEITKRAADLAQTWETIMPAVMEQLSKALFENKPGGGWKSTDLKVIRETVTEKCRYKSSEIRNSLTAGMEAARALGLEAAKVTLPVRAAGVKKWGWTPQGAKAALANRVLFLLDMKYNLLASSLYYAIENALVGNLSILETESVMRNLLLNSPWSHLRAETILDTAMATAWNAARMEQYRELENPDGTTVLDIIAYEFLAVEDEHTTDTCLDLNGKVFAVDDPSLPEPPLHYNCRSLLLPVFGNERDKVTIMDKTESAALVSRERERGGIQDGFGGVR